MKKLLLLLVALFFVDTACAMDRIAGPTATQDRKFTEGDRYSNPKIPATIVTSAWLNGVQEEIAGTVEAEGIVLDPADNTQLHQAIESIVDTHGGVTNPHSATAAATAERLILRDANGRAKVAAPAAADDIARKDTVDTHADITNPHSATSSATASRMMLRDTSGRVEASAAVSGSQVVNYSQFSGSKVGNGHQLLPNGLILQWVTGPTITTGTSTLQTITWPTPFPTVCLFATVSTKVTNALEGNNGEYQLIGSPTTTQAVVYLNTTDIMNVATWNAVVFAIGY